MRFLLLLIIILAVIALFGFWLARARTRAALTERRRAAERQEELDVWVEAERSGLAQRRERDT